MDNINVTAVRDLLNERSRILWRYEVLASQGLLTSTHFYRLKESHREVLFGLQLLGYTR